MVRTKQPARTAKENKRRA